MGKESSDRTQQEQERAEARAALQVEDDEARVELTLPEHITGMGHILSLLSNYVGDTNALFIYLEEKSKCPMPAQYFKYIFELLHQKDVKYYNGLISSEERLDLVYHMAGRLDRFESSFAKAG